MRTLHTSIFIPSDPMHVWDVLTDFPHYPAWHPIITSIAGDLVPRGRLVIWQRGPVGPAYPLLPRLTSVCIGRELSWKAGLVPGGLLDWTHRLHISASAHGVRFANDLVLSGMLESALPPALRAAMRRRLEAENLALRAQVEKDL